MEVTLGGVVCSDHGFLEVIVFGLCGLQELGSSALPLSIREIVSKYLTLFEYLSSSLK